MILVEYRCASNACWMFKGECLTLISGVDLYLIRERNNILNCNSLNSSKAIIPFMPVNDFINSLEITIGKGNLASLVVVHYLETVDRWAVVVVVSFVLFHVVLNHVSSIQESQKIARTKCKKMKKNLVRTRMILG